MLAGLGGHVSHLGRETNRRDPRKNKESLLARRRRGGKRLGGSPSWETCGLLFELLSPVIETLFDAFLHAVCTGFVVGAPFGEVGLGGEVAFVVVRVEVLHGGFVGSGFLSEFFTELGAEVLGDLESGSFFNVGLGCSEGGVGGV